jgi:hypothetical protein
MDLALICTGWSGLSSVRQGMWWAWACHGLGFAWDGLGKGWSSAGDALGIDWAVRKLGWTLAFLEMGCGLDSGWALAVLSMGFNMRGLGWAWAGLCTGVGWERPERGLGLSWDRLRFVCTGHGLVYVRDGQGMYLAMHELGMGYVDWRLYSQCYGHDRRSIYIQYYWHCHWGL